MGTPYLDNLESFEAPRPSESSLPLSDESVPRLDPSSFNNWERLGNPCQSECGLSDIEEALPLLLMSSPSLAAESLVFLVDSVGKRTVSSHELSHTTAKDQNKDSRQAIPNIRGDQSQKSPKIHGKILPALTNNIDDSQLTDRQTADELIKQYTSITTSPFDCHKNLQEQSDELAMRLQEKIKYHGYNNHHVTGALPVRFDDATTSMHCYKNPYNKRIDSGTHKLKAEKSILKVKKSAEVLTDLYEAKKRKRHENISDFNMYDTSATKTSRTKRSRKNKNKVESIDAATDIPSSEDILPGSKKSTKDENKLENLGNVNNVRSVSNIRNIFSRHKQSRCECPATSEKSKTEDEPGSQEPTVDVDAEPDESKTKKKSKAAAKKKKADKSKLKKVDTRSSSSVMGKLFRKHKAEAESQNTLEPGPIESPIDVDAVPDESQMKEKITPSAESEKSKTEEIDTVPSVPSIETPPPEQKKRQSLDKPVPVPNGPEAVSDESQTKKKFKTESKKKKTDKGELKSEDTGISENILRKHTEDTDEPSIQGTPTDVARVPDESQIKQLTNPSVFTEKPKPEEIKSENVDEVPSVASIDTPEPEPKQHQVTVGARYDDPRIEQEPETGEVTPEIVSEEPSIASIDAPVPMPVQEKPRRSVSARYEERRFEEPPPYREPEPEEMEPDTISPVPSDTSVDRPEPESVEPEFGAESDEDYPPEPSDLQKELEPDEFESYGTSKAELDNYENPGVKLQMKPNLFGALRNMFSLHPKQQTPVKPKEPICVCRTDKKPIETKPAEPTELEEPKAVKPREKSEIELSISTVGSTLGSLKCCGGSKIADIMLRTMGADMESSDDASKPRATKFKIEIQNIGEINEVGERASKGCRCKQKPKQEAVSTCSCWPFKAKKERTKKEKKKKKKSKACGKCCQSQDAETSQPDSAAQCTKTNITQTTSCTPCCPLPDRQGIKTQTFRSCPLPCEKANNTQKRRICGNPFCPKRKIQATTSCCSCETRDAQINTDQTVNFCEPFCLRHSSLAEDDQSTTSCRAKPLCPKAAAKNKQIQTNCANTVCPLHHKERCERKCCPVTASPCLQAYKARNSKTCCTKKKSSCFIKPARGKCRGRESPKRCDQKPCTRVPKYKCSQTSLTADMGTFISQIPSYEIFQPPSEMLEAPSEVFLRVEDMQAPRLPCRSSMQMPPICRSPPPVCPNEIARVLGRLQMLGSGASCLCTKEAIQKDLKDIIVKLKKSRKCRKKPQKGCGCAKRTCRPACEIQPRPCFPHRIQLIPSPLPIQPVPQQAAPAQPRVCNDNNDDICQGFKLQVMRKKSGLPGQYCT